MAGEFGISADEVMGLLRQMDVPVRSHLSPLTDDQIARIRARWEREKRARAEKPAPEPTGGRRRKAAASAAPGAPAAPTSRKKVAVVEPPPPPPEPDDAKPGVRRRRRVE